MPYIDQFIWWHFQLYKFTLPLQVSQKKICLTNTYLIYFQVHKPKTTRTNETIKRYFLWPWSSLSLPNPHQYRTNPHHSQLPPQCGQEGSNLVWILCKCYLPSSCLLQHSPIQSCQDWDPPEKGRREEGSIRNSPNRAPIWNLIQYHASVSLVISSLIS